ncbi:MAG: SagB/ThcOx family dehydrogenase [Acidobacteria bacterium]|nr:MAG: SagB/ThcOx family dehydrogenase [Acidobacteriota bacterium]
MLGMSLALGVTTSLKAETPTQAPVQVQLPKPQTEGGKPLMQALNERKSTRAFKTDKLPEQVLSNLLWAAWGTNRPDGKRTAPSAMNRQEIDVYVVSAEGTYMYDAKAHALKPVAAGDLRAQTGGQPFVKDAPLNLVYVADTAKMSGGSEQAVWYGAAAGFISQNVYLYCASEGLATVVRGMVDRDVLARALSLRPEQRIVLSQTVGYPG